MIIILCAVLVSISGARAESPPNPSDTLVSLGTRVFYLRVQSPILDRQVDNNFVPLTDANWSHAPTRDTPETIWLAQSQFSDADVDRFTRAAIAYWIANDQYATVLEFNKATGSWGKRPIRQYESVDEFLSRNPDCCRFGVRDSEGYWPGFWYRYRNNYVGLASIPRIRKTYADTGEEAVFSGRAYAIDRDGQVIEEPFLVD